MPRLTLSIALALTACISLGACGADGAPKPPVTSPVTPGITVSGDAQIGIVSN